MRYEPDGGPYILFSGELGNSKAEIVDRHLAGIAALKCLKRLVNARVCHRAGLCQSRLMPILPSLRDRALRVQEHAPGMFLVKPEAGFGHVPRPRRGGLRHRRRLSNPAASQAVGSLFSGK